MGCRAHSLQHCRGPAPATARRARCIERFDLVLELLEDATEGLLQTILSKQSFKR